MIWFEEVSRSLTAAVLLLSGDREAVWRFNLTPQGFWRSFAAILLVLPFYFFLNNSFLAGAENIGKASLAGTSLRLVAQWLVWLGIVAFISRLLKLSQNYSTYVIVYNWTSVIIMTVITLPVMFFQAGLLAEKPTMFLTGILELVSFYLAYYLTRISLKASAPVAIGLVAGEFASSFALLQFIRLLTQGTG